MPISFSQAAKQRMPFGKYEGEKLDDIGISDEGLKYLDWLRAERKMGPMAPYIRAYLDDPVIKKELAECS